MFSTVPFRKTESNFYFTRRYVINKCLERMLCKVTLMTTYHNSNQLLMENPIQNQSRRLPSDAATESSARGILVFVSTLMGCLIQ